MLIKRPYIQYWDRPEAPLDTKTYGTYWNPSRGNVRVGNRELKWYNYLKNRKL